MLLGMLFLHSTNNASLLLNTKREILANEYQDPGLFRLREGVDLQAKKTAEDNHGLF